MEVATSSPPRSYAPDQYWCQLPTLEKAERKDNPLHCLDIKNEALHQTAKDNSNVNARRLYLPCTGYKFTRIRLEVENIE